MFNPPTVSVLMPTYNAERYLKEAIESILTQTFADFELIIINDGSTDSTEQIIHSFGDPRIRYIKNIKNIGLSPTLNIGLKEATGTYIARMDADDISYPTRLEKQVDFLNKNPDYGIVGCMYIVMDQKRVPYEAGGLDFRHEAEIKLCLFGSNVFVHGETMFRSSIIIKDELRYNSAYNPCEDYDLWIRMSAHTKFCILEDILYCYMINPYSMSGTRWLEMRAMTTRIARELQVKKGLPYISLSQFWFFLKNGVHKQDKEVIFNNQKVQQYHQLNYQEFLFRTGFVYLYQINIQGFQFLVVSFLINPYNWFVKFYRLLFLTHPRLKKEAE